MTPRIRLVAGAALLSTLGLGFLMDSTQAAEPKRGCAPNMTASQWAPVIVSFDTGSIKIRDVDMAKIADAAKLAKDNYIQQVCVTGYADKKGDAKMNRLLSQRRAEAVAAELRKHGVAPNTIVVSGAGEPGGTALDSVQRSSAADRRVEIKFAR